MVATPLVYNKRSQLFALFCTLLLGGQGDTARSPVDDLLFVYVLVYLRRDRPLTKQKALCVELSLHVTMSPPGLISLVLPRAPNV